MKEKINKKPYHLPKDTILAGKYRIQRVEEEGGFSIVYLGHDIVLDMDISIKEYFPRELAGRQKNTTTVIPYAGEAETVYEQGMEKFLAEAKTLAKLQSLTHIVRINDFFYENDTAYIVMDYVRGTNLKDYVEKNGKFSPEQTLCLMRPILFSLQQIHEQGLLHRDISPQNIILTEQKEAFLIDFGTTRPFKKDTYMTHTVFFKRGYAAEEQYREKGEQGPWTDIYSICATMYFMLTGNTPVESVQRNIKDTLPPLSGEKTLALPPEVKRAIDKGMAVSYEKRYQSVDSLCQNLYGKDFPSPFPLPLPSSPGIHPFRKPVHLFLILLCSVLLFLSGMACQHLIDNNRLSKKDQTIQTLNKKLTHTATPATPLPSPTATPKQISLPTLSDTLESPPTQKPTNTPAPTPRKTSSPKKKTSFDATLPY